MRDAFADIERGHEAKYKLDQELIFKAQCRRNKLLGAWAAEHMGLTRAEGEAYARMLVSLNMEQPGVGRVLARVVEDFQRRGVRKGEGDVKVALQKFYTEALESLAREFPKALGLDHVRIGD